MASATQRVAARVAEIRARRGLTQESLAAKARINRVTLARLERAQHPPNLDTLERIARALGVAVVDLVKYRADQDTRNTRAHPSRSSTPRAPIRQAAGLQW